MKKNIFCKVVILFALFFMPFAERKAMGDLIWQSHIFEIGYGMITSPNNCFNLKIFDQFFQHRELPFVFEIIPVTYNYSGFYDGHMVSLINAKLSLGDISTRGFLAIGIIIGPFISISPLNFPDYKPANYILDAGLRFAVLDNRLGTFIDLEIGSRYYEQNRNIYMNISTSIFFVR